MIPKPDEQPDELRLGEPAEAAGEVLRQALHQQQPDAAEQPDRRQQDLVGPPPGQDERGVHQEQRAEVDRASSPASAGVVRSTVPGSAVEELRPEPLRRAERHGADVQGERDDDRAARARGRGSAA